MPNSTSPKRSFHARQQARKEEPQTTVTEMPVRSQSPEELAAIERFYATGLGAPEDTSRPSHLI